MPTCNHPPYWKHLEYWFTHGVYECKKCKQVMIEIRSNPKTLSAWKRTPWMDKDSAWFLYLKLEKQNWISSSKIFKLAED
jgi:hypothetical protein